jgi:small GTP-binding protein
VLTCYLKLDVDWMRVPLMAWKKGRSEATPTSVEEMLRVFPPAVREGLQALYSSLEPGQRAIILPMLRRVWAFLDADDLKQVLQLVKEQYHGLIGVAPAVCIVGPVNVGKSSLYNVLVQEGEDRAEVSAVPGTTMVAQIGRSGILTVVDTPGADEVETGAFERREGQSRRKAALAAARSADFLVMVFDASAGIGRGALAVYRDLESLGKPYVVVLNKIDLVQRQADQVVARAAGNLGVGPEAIIATSALKGSGLKELIFALIRMDPRLLLTVAEVMPHYQFTLAQRRTLQAATAAGTVNLATAPIPIPFASFLPLTGLQAGLVLSIARIYGYEITRARARELLTTFVAGLGARTLFQQLVTKVPGAGWALGTAIAAATTLTMGYSAIAWFVGGKKITAQVTRDNLELVTQEILAGIQTMDRDNLSREGLAEILDGITTRLYQNLRNGTQAET